MGWPGSDELGCKKHPKHRQSPGVCSICLREKLAQLSSSKIFDAASSYFISSLSSAASSSGSPSSSYSSPISYDVLISSSTTTTTTNKGQVSLLVSGKDGLKRSRSMAFIGARKRLDQDQVLDPAVIDKNRKMKIKKGGFWSRLLGLSSKMKKEPLMHSKTMKEARVTRLV